MECLKWNCVSPGFGGFVSVLQLFLVIRAWRGWSGRVKTTVISRRHSFQERILWTQINVLKNLWSNVAFALRKIIIWKKIPEIIVSDNAENGFRFYRNPLTISLFLRQIEKCSHCCYDSAIENPRLFYKLKQLLPSPPPPIHLSQCPIIKSQLHPNHWSNISNLQSKISHIPHCHFVIWFKGEASFATWRCRNHNFFSNLI